MSNQLEDDFSLDGVVGPDDMQLPKLRAPKFNNDIGDQDITLPCDGETQPTHRVKASCAKRTVHTSSRLKKIKVAKPAPPPKVKVEVKDDKGAIKAPKKKVAPTEEEEARRTRSLELAKRIITEAINHAIYAIEENFVRLYGKHIKAMKKDLVEGIKSGANSAADVAIQAILKSKESSANHN